MTFPVEPGADAFGAGAFASSQTSWKSRVRDGAYTSPSGTRITFEFSSISREVDRRATVFEFPGVDGAFVQQGGYGARRYPLRCMFGGPQHDLIATAFEKALLEPGIGKLEHPLYGGVESISGKTRPINVVPLGTITRSENLVEGGNVSIVEVTFSTTLASVYPAAVSDPQNEIDALLGRFNVALAQQFAASTDLRSVVNKASAVAKIKRILKKISATLTKISDSVAGVRRKFADAQAELNGAIDILIGQPVLLAQQCVNLVLAPSRAAAGIGLRLQGYLDLFASLEADSKSGAVQTAESVGGVSSAVTAQQAANEFQISALFAMAAAAGQVSALVQKPVGDDDQPIDGVLNAFSSRAVALQSADAVLDAVDQTIAWRDAGFADLVAAVPSVGLALGTTDTGEGYQALLDAARAAAAYAVQLSFSLLPEKRLVLDRDRTILDVCAELYGSVDDKLDLLINTNNLTGSEILELPKGRTILYYPGA